MLLTGIQNRWYRTVFFSTCARTQKKAIQDSTANILSPGSSCPFPDVFLTKLLIPFLILKNGEKKKNEIRNADWEVMGSGATAQAILP